MSDLAKVVIDNRPYFHVARVGEELLVYRSVVVREDSELFEPVADLLVGWSAGEPAVVEDESMMFGRAVLTVYECDV